MVGPAALTTREAPERAAAQQRSSALLGVQGPVASEAPVPPPTTPGEAGAAPRTPRAELPDDDEAGGDSTPAAVPTFDVPTPGVVPIPPPGWMTVPLNGPAGAPPTGGLASGPVDPGVPDGASGVAVCAKHAGAAAINAAAIAAVVDFISSMKASFNVARKPHAPQEPCRRMLFRLIR
jgi:hypothetical protein